MYNDLILTQHNLFKINSYIASKGDKKYLIEQREVNNLETNIDLMESKLPQLKNFILPGGSVVSAHLHIGNNKSIII